MENKPPQESLTELFKTLESVKLFPSDETNWTVQLMNEEDPEGPVVFKDENGQDKMWMPQDIYQQFLELAKHSKR